MSASTADLVKAMNGPFAGLLAPVARADEALDNTRENVAAFGATVWGRAFMHLVHVAAFITLVLRREDTVMPLTGWLTGVLGSFAWGIPANLLHVAASSFDGFWTLILGVVL